MAREPVQRAGDARGAARAPLTSQRLRGARQADGRSASGRWATACAPKRTPEELLDIPAFLRRQAD